jgi:HD-GYP domain-containing protein (c-di-GMP phosphodiesterase class II)
MKEEMLKTDILFEAHPSRRVVPLVPTGREPDRLAALQQENARLYLLLDTAQVLGSEPRLDLLMSRLVERTSRIMNCERSSVYLFDAERQELYSLVAQGLEIREIRMPSSTGLAGYVARTGKRLNVADAYKSPHFSPEWDKRTGFRTVSALTLPLHDRKGGLLGVIQCLNKLGPANRLGPFDTSDESFLAAVAALASTFLDNAKLYRGLDKLLESVVSAFSRAIEDRDPSTSGHTRRVTALSLRLANAVHAAMEPPFDRMTYTFDRFRQLRYAALLHDVGKIGVREHVLCKADKLPLGGLQLLLLRLALMRETRRGELLLRAWQENLERAGLLEREFEPFSTQVERALALVAEKNRPGPITEQEIAQLAELHGRGWLTDDELEYLSIRKGNLNAAEMEHMKSHVAKSYQMLLEIPWPKELKDVPAVAYAHHERGDGSGYPRALKADEINFDGQLLAIADVYDALVASDRPYKKAIPHEAARRILEEEAFKRRTLNSDLVWLFFEKECYKLPEYQQRTTQVVKLAGG